MLEILLSLYVSFFKIGLFGFGGGYAMISLIQKELERFGWLNLEEFVDIVAIAQMTPGPIAINSGTFVGFRTSTFWGALTATIAVITPSFILILILAHSYKKIMGSKCVETILDYLRPTVIGLIFIAAFTLIESSIVDPATFIIALAVIGLMLKTNIDPILVIILAGISGAIIYA